MRDRTLRKARERRENGMSFRSLKVRPSVFFAVSWGDGKFFLIHSDTMRSKMMARPGRLELPTLCLEGRRSIQLSYGRAGYFDSKSFIARKSTILARLPSAERGRSIQVNYAPVLGYTLILLKLQNRFGSRFFRNLGATWSNWNGRNRESDAH